MNQIIIQQEPKPGKPTLFRLKHNEMFHSDNYNKNCSRKEIELLLHKNLINPIDLEIIMLLATYKYINSYNIVFYLNQLSYLQDFYKKQDYHNNIKKLRKMGIVLRYTLIPATPDDAVTLPLSASSLRCYDLSPGAYSYIQHIIEKPHAYQQKCNDKRIMELLALNQFVFHFLYDNKTEIQQYRYLLPINRKENVFMDTIFRLKHVSLLVHVMRDYEDIRNYKEQMVQIYQWINKQEINYPNPVILYLVENTNMMLLVSKLLYASFLDGIPYYFVVDAIFPSLSHLYTYSESENSIYHQKTGKNFL